LVSATADRSDVPRMAAIVAKCLPQEFDPLRHGFFAHNGGRPYPADQLIERHDGVAAYEQIGQQVESEPAHLDGCPQPLDTAAIEIDPQVQKFVERCHHGTVTSPLKSGTASRVDRGVPKAAATLAARHYFQVTKVRWN